MINKVQLSKVSNIQLDIPLTQIPSSLQPYKQLPLNLSHVWLIQCLWHGVLQFSPYDLIHSKKKCGINNCHLSKKYNKPPTSFFLKQCSNISAAVYLYLADFQYTISIFEIPELNYQGSFK